MYWKQKDYFKTVSTTESAPTVVPHKTDAKAQFWKTYTTGQLFLR